MIKHLQSKLFVVTFLVALICFSCSKDDNTEKAMYVKGLFSFTNTDVWPARYQLLLAGFGSDTLNPLAFSIIENPGEKTLTTVDIPKLSAEARLIKLIIANQAKQPIYTLYRKEFPGALDTLELAGVDIKLLTFNRLQAQVLKSCIVCHGGSSGAAAAGLNLTPEQGYAVLVNQNSTHSSKKRVVPQNTAASFVVDVLRNKQTEFVHSASNTIDEEDIVLFEKWIGNGALKD